MFHDDLDIFVEEISRHPEPARPWRLRIYSETQCAWAGYWAG